MSRDQEQRQVETPSLKPSPVGAERWRNHDPKFLVGPITSDADCERYARILQPGYQRSCWYWREPQGERNGIPSVQQIDAMIHALLGDAEEEGEYSCAGLTVKREDGRPVLYAHFVLSPRSSNALSVDDLDKAC